jgi:hypothetical protein
MAGLQRLGLRTSYIGGSETITPERSESNRFVAKASNALRRND